MNIILNNTYMIPISPLRSVCASTQQLGAAAARKKNDAAVDDIMSPIFPEENTVSKCHRFKNPSSSKFIQFHENVEIVQSKKHVIKYYIQVWAQIEFNPKKKCLGCLSLKSHGLAFMGSIQFNSIKKSMETDPFCQYLRNLQQDPVNGPLNLSI